jgi:hypothetical protein
MQAYLESNLEPAVMQGMFLKIAGAGLLCLLYFTAVGRIAAGDRAKAWLLSALGVGWAGSFAIFAVMAPLASYFRWSFQVLTAYVPGYYETGQAQRLQEVIAAQGIATAAGVLVLGVSLVLLGAVFLHFKRGFRFSPVSHGALGMFVVAAAFDAERRAVTNEPSIIELLQRASLIDVAAMIVVVCIAAVGVVSLILGRKKPRLSARIVGYAVLFLGGFAIVTWVSLAGTITEMRPSMRFGEAYVSPADLANAIERGWMTNYFFSWLMLVACIVLPLVCAVAMRRMSRDKEPAGGKNSKAPLWGMFAVLAIFVGAGVCGAWEDPYHRSLRTIAANYGEEGLKAVREHARRLDSDEGLAFLRRSMYDHDQFFYHRFIIEHLWKYSRHPRARRAVLDMLCDTEQPAAALYARDIIVNNLWSDNLRDYYHLHKEEGRVSTLEMLTPILMQEPHYGTKILRITIESRNANGGFFFDIMKVCARAGVTSFVLPEWKPHRGDEEYSLQVPAGFTIHYNRKPADKKGAMTIRLLWCEPGDPCLPDPSCLPGPVAFVGDKQLASIIDEMGERRPKYSELIEMLQAQITEAGSESFVPSLVIDRNTLSEQVMHLLNACAAAGVAEVSFVEP